MADTLTLELVTPERRLLQTEAQMVVLPGVEGEFGAMPGHAPVVSALRPGLLRVHGADGVAEYVVIDGFVEVTGTHVRVLAGEAVLRAEFDPGMLEARAQGADEAEDRGRAGALRELTRQLS